MSGRPRGTPSRMAPVGRRVPSSAVNGAAACRLGGGCVRSACRPRPAKHRSETPHLPTRVVTAGHRICFSETGLRGENGHRAVHAWRPPPAPSALPPGGHRAVGRRSEWRAPTGQTNPESQPPAGGLCASASIEGGPDSAANTGWQSASGDTRCAMRATIGVAPGQPPVCRQPAFERSCLPRPPPVLVIGASCGRRFPIGRPVPGLSGRPGQASWCPDGFAAGRQVAGRAASAVWRGRRGGCGLFAGFRGAGTGRGTHRRRARSAGGARSAPAAIAQP